MKNVLFILVDDLRPEINCFGKEKLITPNIDELSKNSTLFNNCYCQVPVCMSSRASLFSGIRPLKGTLFGLDSMRFNEETTMPQAFKDNGYETISVGKSYHFNNEDEEAWTKKYRHTFTEEKTSCHGFCSGYQLESNVLGVANYHKRLDPNFPQSEKAKLQYGEMIECVDVDDSKYPDFQTASYAIDELINLSQSKKKFFMTVGLYRPHLPWAVPKKYFDLYDVDKIDIAPNQFFPKNGIGKTGHSDFVHYNDKIVHETYSDIGHYKDEDFPVLPEKNQREYIRAYCASVSFMDAQVGRVMNALKSLGMDKDTIIVFAGDNGWHLGEHKLWSKTSQFEESTHVPLMIYADGLTKGEKTTRLAELLDIYPTLCELSGIEKPEHLDGVSLVDTLKDKNAIVNQAIYSTYMDAYTVRTEEYRMTYYQNASPQGDFKHIPNKFKFELFDLKKDPAENENVFANEEYKEVSQMLQELLKKTYSINE